MLPILNSCHHEIYNKFHGHMKCSLYMTNNTLRIDQVFTLQSAWRRRLLFTTVTFADIFPKCPARYGGVLLVTGKTLSTSLGV